MASLSKGPPGGVTSMTAGKKNRLKTFCEDDSGSKRMKYGNLSSIMGDTSTLNRHKIYNYGIRKKPAELFRKDLISAMKMADSDQLNPDEYLQITDPWKEEWEKGVQVPVNPDSLPESDVISLEESLHRIKHPEPSSHDPQPSTCGAGDSDSHNPSSSPTKISKKLLKFEVDRDAIASRYELDLTDYCWLESLEDSEESLVIPEHIFEDVMNELEFQCAKNMKAKHVGIEFDDHIVCDVCRSPDAEDGNEMVFCDACNICVHQACYGISVIPDGEWLCKACKEFGSASQKKVSCVLCPNVGGAFKPTSTNRWAHVSCALWIPEVSIGCVSSMEPITKIKSIPISRWNLVCSLCNIKLGAPIQCSEKTCKTAYHVTCAFSQNLKMKAIVEDETKGVKLKSFCSKHSEGREESSDSDGVLNQHEIEIATSGSSESDKNNRFWMYIDINEVNQVKKEYSDLSTPTLQMYIDLVLQYWKMKRTSNFGLPLIKVVTADTIEEIEMARRNDILRLRVNLERIRNLSYMICRREKMKRSWLMAHKAAVERAICGMTGVTLASEANSSGDVPLSPNSPQKRQGSPSRGSNFVSDEKITLVKNIVNSHVIYNTDNTPLDKLRAKRVVKELNRMIEVDRLRKRRHNPYARHFLPQLNTKRSNSFGSSDQLQKEESGSTDSSHMTPTHAKKTSAFNGAKPRPVVNGSSILVRTEKSHKSPSDAGVSRSPSENNHVGTSLLIRNKKCSGLMYPKSGKSPPPVTRSSLFGYKIPKKKRPVTDPSSKNYSSSLVMNGHSSSRIPSTPDASDDHMTDDDDRCSHPTGTGTPGIDDKRMVHRMVHSNRTPVGQALLQRHHPSTHPQIHQRIKVARKVLLLDNNFVDLPKFKDEPSSSHRKKECRKKLRKVTRPQNCKYPLDNRLVASGANDVDMRSTHQQANIRRILFN